MGGGPRMTNEQKQMAFRLRAAGFSHKEIARQVCCSHGSFTPMFRDRQRLTGVADTWSPRPGRLQVEEREQILIGLARGDSLSAIARVLGRSPSTVTREVERNGGRENYVAWRAHVRARSETRRPKGAKLCRGPLLKAVTKGLEAYWSPQEISRRLPLDYPDDPEMRVSHETIYQSLYVQGRGELRRELARCLRTGRAKRKKQGGVPGSGKIPNMVMISDRPAEIEDRAVPGHWEGDLIIGARGKSAVGTLVERSTRLVLLLHLANDHGAEAVAAAMSRAIWTLPEELARSVTWDQGMEMANHVDFTVTTGIPVYFCDPHSPPLTGQSCQPSVLQESVAAGFSS